METKKSHKADLEHLRPWMFLGAFCSIILVTFLVLEVRLTGLTSLFESDDDEVAIDLNMIQKDERDLIAAAEKEEQKETDQIKKVDEEVIEQKEELEVLKFDAEAKVEEEEKEEVEEQKPVNLNDDDPETLQKVQDLPEYPGGMSAFVRWLTKNLKYPPRALKDKIEGRVMISFIVNKDGSLSDIKVEKSAHVLLDNEALRVARLMPKWKPGHDHGKICATKVAVPIVFEI